MKNFSNSFFTIFTASLNLSINPGWNWIGFPYNETVSIEDAFAGFEATEGDILKNLDGVTQFEDGDWFGDLEELVPGQGYLYFSNSDEPKTLIFQTGQ